MIDARMSAGGAVATAVTAAASWLCCLPFALGALGATGSALSHFLGPIQPYVTGVSVVLIGVAFFQSYRPGPVENCAMEGDCDSADSTGRRRQFLWIAATLTVLFLTVPYWLNWVIFWTL